MDRLGLVVKSNEALLPAVFHSHLSRSIISLLTKTCHGCLMEVATSEKWRLVPASAASPLSSI
jgi:hypothetical protein